ncbi:MAG: serine/threonine-protein kinase [Acidobacteriota bacterium]|nr:serine/threonine-protein kinase [Acidobacteriota bacterium]
MTIHSGTRLGPYEILASIGAGGMGEVYRASDSRLGRDVAIKVLPEEFFEDGDRVARFEREAKSLAALNHPGIAAVYAFEEIAARHLIVMELVEGEDLAERLAAAPLDGQEALAWAKQIAEALEAAHEKGIVHRDLKPANVKVTPDGRVKLLDFGLAKIYEPDPARSSPSATRSPTITGRATAAGVILGTAAYMSPEQARGKTVDKRTDVWAFGCVLFEMLAGKRAFEGETVSDTLVSVLSKEPDWGALPASSSSVRLKELLRRCLQRDPKQRLRDIGDARISIEEEIAGASSPASSSSSVQAPPPQDRRSGSSRWIPWAVAAAFAAAAGTLALRAPSSRGATAPAGAVRLAFLPPDNVAFDATGIDFLSVSPNGRMVVFTGRSPDGKAQLWLRSLDSSEARVLPGTEDSVEPFWSPDSRSIGFGARGKLMRLDLAGGRPQVLADAPRLVGGTWSRDGKILFMSNWSGRLVVIPAEGGKPKILKQFGRNPSFLPDGRHFLYWAGIAWADPKVYLGSVDSDEERVLTAGAAARYAAPGWLLFVRDGTLMAHAFDAARLALSGDGIPIDTARTSLNNDGIPFSVSETGVLLFQRNLPREYQLAWFDRAGRQLDTVGPRAKLGVGLSFSLSPDGTRVVVANREQPEAIKGIWVIDLARGIPTRVGANGQMPAWEWDGAHVAWQGGYSGTPGMFRRAANGVAAVETLIGGPNTWTNGFSPDGRFLLYVTRGETTRADIWALPLFGDRKPHPVVATEFEEIQAQVSPDGRWLAYRSDVSGTFEIYVQPFTVDGTVGGERWRISTAGGTQPRFRRDGGEMFYLADDGQLMAVALRAKGSTLEYGAPTPLFRPRMMPRGAQPWFEYDVDRDGKRFLVGTVFDGAGTPPPSAVVVLNWTEELKGKAARP